MATLLPGPALLLGRGLPPARHLLDAGATVALATDVNAGTWSNGSLPLAIGLGAAVLGMTIAEALEAATWGGARSLGVGGRIGLLAPGYRADLVAGDAEHEGAFALHFGAVHPLRIWSGGSQVG